MLHTLSKFKKSLLDVQKNRGLYHIPNLPLDFDQTQLLCSMIESNFEFSKKDMDFVKHHFQHRIVPGVDSTSYQKAELLRKVCNGPIKNNFFDKKTAVEILGTMQGGYNVEILSKLLLNEELGKYACEQLKSTILIFDYFNDIEDFYKKGNIYSKELLESWAEGEWFTKNPSVPQKITLTAFKVTGEINTDDLSPAPDAWSRPDIPLHAQCMLKTPREGIQPDEPFSTGPLKLIDSLKKNNLPIVFVGDVVGTGSSRKSATNSILWHFGNDIPYIPNKRNGGFCFGGKIAPIFFNTMEDSGALPIEMDVENIHMGDIIDIYPYEGSTKVHGSHQEICSWKLSSPTILDSVKANGRINLIIGKSLTEKAQNALSLYKDSIFLKKDSNLEFQDLPIANHLSNNNKKKKYTLAQKMVGKACGVEGILPGEYCEPTITSVGSQDTTGPMTRDELKDLACLGFSADLVMQSFCHTAAYPKPIDLITHSTLPKFISERGGISLKPGDGIIHSWLNRMLLPDTVGTGGDSHTRFPIGISFPAGSGLVAFAAATGKMPLDMPESVLVKFTGKIQPGVTLRDLVHSIPYFALKKNLLTLDKKNKKNIFSGRILEIEGLPDLTCEQAFELSDASAERSASGCTIKLNKESIIEYLKSNISLLEWMIKNNYNDKDSIQRRISKMKKWINEPALLEADEGAEYFETLEINMNEITEPILCAPNDPDAAVLLSEVQNNNIDEVFIGSCMTNIGHFRAAGKLLQQNSKSLNSTLWIAPPTKMDEKKLKEEGYYEIFEKSNVKMEIPGCSLCMGNQARVNDNAKVLSTSTRNFPNRLGKGADVYLASAELSAITAIEGKIPDKKKYMEYFDTIESQKKEIFNYLNFNQLKL
tara:strand:+ start:4596 stop:7223 length:2628 start_codon:yes stop_codon:yes gene_type:complete